ncbi:hypothetical protein MIMGU_mgv1a0264542mg, partial [Erythranthe guttata]
ASDSCAL